MRCVKLTVTGYGKQFMRATLGTSQHMTIIRQLDDTVPVRFNDVQGGGAVAKQ